MPMSMASLSLLLFVKNAQDISMFARSAFISNKIYKKPMAFFKNGCKKIVSIIKCNEKNCLKRITL